MTKSKKSHKTSENKEKIYHPHDKLCKKIMEDPKNAREFFETYLPADLLALLDLDSLQPAKETFITALFENRAPDFIYEVKFKLSGDVLFLLCEQQTNLDREIAFRFLENTYLLMSRYKKQYPGKQLPLVYPLLIYIGQSNWTAPRDIFGLLGTNEALARDIFLKPYQMIDLFRTPDEVLRQHGFSGMMEYALKYGEMPYKEAFFDILSPWMNELLETDNARAKLVCEDVLFYLMRKMREVSLHDCDVLINKIRKDLPKNLQETIMNFEQAFEQRGEQKGFLLGEQKGEQKGFDKAMHAVAEKLLQEKALPLEKIADLTGLPIDALHALETEHKKRSH